MKFVMEISIDVPTKEHAAKIAIALQEIKNRLTDSDLIELAEILKKRPGIIKTAKMFLRG